MRKIKRPSGTRHVTMSVEMSDGTEREMSVRFHVNPAERADEFYPGCPEHAEYEGAVWEDDGTEVPEGMVDVEGAEEQMWSELQDQYEAAMEGPG